MTQAKSYEAHSEAHTKLIQIFRYLQALNQVRNPVKRDINGQPWTMWFHDLPEHPCIRRGVVLDTALEQEPELEQENAPQSATVPAKTTSANVNEDFILKVRRPTLTEPPAPPQEIAPWLLNGWQSVDGKVIERPSITTSDGVTERILKFDDDPQRRQLLEEWKRRRDQWVEVERPARQTMDIFDKLYALQAQLERETERLELMLGDGLLTWQLSNGDMLHHPLLLLRIQLSFAPQIPEFTLAAREYPPELYTALLRAVPEVNPLAIGRCREELDRENWHPLGGVETDHFLKRVVIQLSPYGEFGEKAASQRKNAPSITRDPVVFLRSRTLGFSTAFENILEDLPHNEQLPGWLSNVVGIEHTADRQPPSEPGTRSIISPNGEDEHVLLSKPANAEQLEIAQRLERDGAVLVQGPPGTGKTHTIANLLGHLLAQGKSVLVTSHTAKALQVLRDQVVEPLQPLCVSVLDDSNSNKQMERTVDAITERLASSDADVLERQATTLTQERLALLHQLRETRQRLSEARYDEYRAIVWAGREISPSEAARSVREQRETASWIPAPVAPGAPLPLTEGELIELYRSNALITPRDEKEMMLFLPEPEKLVTPVDFEHLIAERVRLQKENLAYRQELWYQVPQHQVRGSLVDLQNRFVQATEILRDHTGWRLAALAAGREGGPRRQAWEDLIAEVESVYALAAQAHTLLLKYGPVLPPDCLPGRVEKVLEEIIAELEGNGKLQNLKLLLHRDWKTLIETAKVNGHPPELSEHFKALLALVQVQTARENLLNRWQRQMVPLGGPPPNVLGPEPERPCRQYMPQLRQCLQWFAAIWAPLERELAQHGFNWLAFLNEMPINMAEHGEIVRLREAVLTRLPAVIAAEVNRRAYVQNEARLLEIQRQLELVGGSEGAGGTKAEVVQQTLLAAKQLNTQAYRLAFGSLVDLHTRRAALQRRLMLLAKLEKLAPAWAAALRKRQGVHGGSALPGNAGQAWRWRQLNDELERRAGTSLEALQEQIAKLSNALQRVTADLVEKKAWAAQVRHTTLAQRQALQGWKALIKKVGKGTGKRAPRLLAEARQLMPICQSAIPVWIMPLSRVVESFDARRNHFDVVIIDEASQADMTALAAVYMGRQVIVVGDEEQVSPVAVGENLDDIQGLIDEHLKGIPGAALYDGSFSIYELAQINFPPVCLREHFRCVPPIIQFSNALSYAGKIKPLRDASLVQRCPPTVAYRVHSSTLKGHTNEEEALAVASLLIAATEQPEYSDATFGVISMVSDEQAIYIGNLLRRYLPPMEIANRRVQYGNAAQFQGDERDVMFLSMVDVPSSTGGPLTLREDGPKNIFKKRFNVAASRARDQLWVVYSLDPDIDLKPTDIRRRLIQHAKNPWALEQQLAVQEQQTESEFEKQVLHRLAQAGYRVIPQWPVGAYRIDLVVEGAGKRLAVECDGDRWHPKEKLEEDMGRQAILERLGWRFARIRGSQFFRNPDKAMEVIFARLQALEIPPEGTPVSNSLTNQHDEELQERIVRRAAELRQQWAAATTTAYSQLSAKQALSSNGISGGTTSASPTDKPDSYTAFVP